MSQESRSHCGSSLWLLKSVQELTTQARPDPGAGHEPDWRRLNSERGASVPFSRSKRKSRMKSLVVILLLSVVAVAQTYTTNFPLRTPFPRAENQAERALFI
jgi:hypothetical protein